MTDITKGWRAEMPKVGAPYVGCHSSDVSAIVARANAELEARDKALEELKAQVTMWRKDLLACMKDRDQIYLDRDKRLEEAQAANRELKTRVKSWQERAIELEEQRDAVLAEYIARLEGAQAANRALNERLQEALMQLGGEP